MPALRTSETDSRISMPWGNDPPFPLELPPSWPVAEPSWPDLSGALADYPRALGDALDDPAGGEGLTRGLGPGEVRRHRRGRPVAVDARPRSPAGRPGQAQAGGRTRRGRDHQRRSRPASRGGCGSMRKRVGDGVVDAIRCFSPPVDDRSQYVDLGTDARGGAGAGLPPGGRGRRAGPDRLGPAAPPGGLRRRLQADLPGDEPPLDTGGAPPSGARGGRRQAAGRRRGEQPDAAGDPLGGGPAAGPLRLDQPPDGRPRARSCGCVSGRPEAVQDVLAAEARRRFRATGRAAGRRGGRGQ